jgi:hypothetical protein
MNPEMGPRSPIVKYGGVKWNTATSDFPEVQSYINAQGRMRPEKMQRTTVLVWMTPEQVKQKQIELFNQRRGNAGEKIYGRKNIGYEHKQVKKLKQRMVRGDTFTPLTFYHDRFGKIEEPQEGAHRTHAINELDIKKVPVWLTYQKGKSEGLEYKHYPETERVIGSVGKTYQIGDRPVEMVRGFKKIRNVNKFYGI